jgi:hypothetical protein
MGFRFVAVFLIASVCAAQTPAPAPSDTPSTPPQITVPPGTSIAITLLNPIKSKTTKPGDTVRAVVAFPVTVGTQLAIPAGTYVQGVVNAIAPHPSHGLFASVKIHFTSLLFANGYSPALDAINTEAMLIVPDPEAGPRYEIADARDGVPVLGNGFAPVLGQSIPPTPVLPPLPQVGPPKGLVIGASLGGTAAIFIGILAYSHHRMNTLDYVVFDNGWQFSMVLTQPLRLDPSQVAAATSAPAQN